MNQNYPKIVFIGAAQFENSTGSHLQFYRLFLHYPPDKLLVICAEKYSTKSNLNKRLPNVSYLIMKDIVDQPKQKKKQSAVKYLRNLHNNRECKKYINKHQDLIQKEVETFRPDLVLSLTMDYYWYVAYSIAKDLDIHLDLILHDRWQPHIQNKMLVAFLNSKFKKVLKYSRNRFCISPTMSEFYKLRTGITSDVLYPLGNESIMLNKYETPNAKKHLKVVYFGNIWSNSSTLVDLAHMLDETDDELIVFSNQSKEFFMSNGLKTRNLHANSFMDNNKELIAWCHKNADILYLPMSFEDKFKEMVKCSFPSKLADYLSIGLPIILHAPKIASIIEFALQNMEPPFAEIITVDSPVLLKAALNRMTEPGHRLQLGQNSINVWEKYFKAEKGRASFFKKIALQP